MIKLLWDTWIKSEHPSVFIYFKFFGQVSSQVYFPAWGFPLLYSQYNFKWDSKIHSLSLNIFNYAWSLVTKIYEGSGLSVA